MTKTKRNSPYIKIRIFMVFCFFIIIFGIITIRLYLLQIGKEGFFKELGAHQYQVELNITPPRAQIFDRLNIPLALNKKVESVFILPHQMSEKEKTMKFLKTQFPKVHRYVLKNPNKLFAWIDRRISSKNKELINKHKIQDIQYLNEDQRFYSLDNLSPILGFTNIDNIGIAGLELQHNTLLTGEPTRLAIEKDARSGKFYFTRKIQKKGEEGKAINLTIDSKLQYLVYKELEETVKFHNAKEGSAIIINPQNGEILAMANYPCFNPNKEVKNLEITKNKTMTECYEFGSVIKVFAALSALEEEVTTLDEVIDCEGKVTYIDRFRIENWKSVGNLSFRDVVRYSSNVGIAKIAKRLGPKLFENFEKLGFNKPTGLEFPGERSGFITPPNKWSRSSVFALSFGYEISATLLQLAKAFSIIANGGYDVSPKLTAQENQENQKKLFSDKSIEQTKEILETIGQRYKIEGFKVMGKTGTARMAERSGYSKTRHVYTFGGIVEKGNYKRVIITFIKEPKNSNLWAAQLTGPLFKQIAEKMVLYDQLESNI